MHMAISPLYFFFFNDTATTEIYTLSLHDAFRSARLSSAARTDGSPSRELPRGTCPASSRATRAACPRGARRSEEHTSELQSQSNLVCRLLLEKKKKNTKFLQHFT